MPTLTHSQERAIYATWWAVKFTQGRWLTFVRASLPDGTPYFTTFADQSRVVALAAGVAPEVSQFGDSRVRIAGWLVYDGLAAKLNQEGWRCLVVDAPLALTIPGPAMKGRVRK